MMPNMRSCARVALAGSLCLVPASSVWAATFTVTRNADDNLMGSLRWAINQANANPGPDTIKFNIPLNQSFRIYVTSPLPTITDTVLIDGHSQPGVGQFNPLIELNGSVAGQGTDGLLITSINSTIQSLIIDRFDGAGIHITDRAIGNQILNCWIGMNNEDFVQGFPDYNNTMRNEVGILIDGYAQENTIGGPDHLANSFDRNTITGNRHGGVRIEGNAQGNAVVNNDIGTDPGANVLLRNGNVALYETYGVKITGGATDNWIGSPQGVASGDRAFGNIIAGVVDGVLIDGTGGNFVQDNYIGIDKTGFVKLPNFNGVTVVNGAIGSVIGGSDNEGVYAYTFGNVITNNSNAGVIVTGDSTRGITIRYNSIYGNGTDFANDEPQLGIQLGLSTFNRLPNDVLDVDEGANHLQNWPFVGKVVNENFFSSTTYGVIFSEPFKNYTIDVYENETCQPRLLFESNAQFWYGSQKVTTNQDGVADFAIHLGGEIPENLFITAIATSDDGSSSEIGPCQSAKPQTPTADMVVTGSAPMFGDGTGSFIISITNQGPAAARNVVLADTLPPGLTLLSCSSTRGGVCGGSGNQRSVSFGSIRPGEVATVTLNVSINLVIVPPGEPFPTLGGPSVDTAGGISPGAVTISNPVMVTSDTSDPNPFNNVTTLVMTVTPPPCLTIGAVTATPDPRAPRPRGFMDVTLDYTATDGCASALMTCTVTIAGGDADDSQVIDAHHVRLRAAHEDRSYTIAITCTDTDGNQTTRSVIVSTAQLAGPPTRDRR
jgi:uncharacterized repeat protein (TIGR01451 family)